MKRLFALTALLLCLCLLAGCAGGKGSRVTEIKLSDSGIEISGGGAKAEGNVVTISAVGEYSVSGLIGDGQIVVDTGDEAVNVTLILNGAEITNPGGPAIHIRQAKDARIRLAEGTKNGVTSGTGPDMALDRADGSGAAIFAEDDLDIEGEGELIVCGYINNGIACKDDLDINSGNITVYAANNGIRGSDSVEIKGGNIAVSAGNDGIKSTATDKAGKGYVTVSGGTVAVNALGDGISAETELSITGGLITVSAQGDPAQTSSKGVKAGAGLSISGGSLTVEATDHAVHSGADLSVNGGVVTASSSEGKAFAAHGDIRVAGGELSLSAKSDGMETSGDVALSGGSLEISAGDDGIQAGEANSGVGTVTVSGGQVKISAKGRGVNARGQLVLNGGVLIALSGSDKTVVPAETGSQAYVSVGWIGADGDDLTLLTADGQELTAFTAARPYKQVLASAPELEEGAGYTLSKGLDSISVTAAR